jgi:hypothetical protein
METFPPSARSLLESPLEGSKPDLSTTRRARYTPDLFHWGSHFSAGIIGISRGAHFRPIAFCQWKDLDVPYRPAQIMSWAGCDTEDFVNWEQIVFLVCFTFRKLLPSTVQGHCLESNNYDFDWYWVFWKFTLSQLSGNQFRMVDQVRVPLDALWLHPLLRGSRTTRTRDIIGHWWPYMKLSFYLDCKVVDEDGCI